MRMFVQVRGVIAGLVLGKNRLLEFSRTHFPHDNFEYHG
jgi:hypothetical protein